MPGKKGENRQPLTVNTEDGQVVLPKVEEKNARGFTVPGGFAAKSRVEGTKENQGFSPRVERSSGEQCPKLAVSWLTGQLSGHSPALPPIRGGCCGAREIDKLIWPLTAGGGVEGEKARLGVPSDSWSAGGEGD